MLKRQVKGRSKKQRAKRRQERDGELLIAQRNLIKRLAPQLRQIKNAAAREKRHELIQQRRARWAKWEADKR